MYFCTEGTITRKVIVAIAVVILCVILIAVLFVVKSKFASTSNDEQNSLYVAKFEITQAWKGTSEGTTWRAVSEGNITLVNPTDTAFNNLNITIKLDESDLSWYSNYSISWTPNPNQEIFGNLLNQTANVNFSPQEPIIVSCITD